MAQSNLALAYLSGQGVEQNYAEAAGWFHRAAAQGHATAQSYLGSMYRDGKGVAKDFAEALKWLTKAADQGDASAQADLGAMYARGQGTTEDNVQALKWLSLAVSNEDTTESDARAIVTERARMRKKMTASEISQAEELAREWFAVFVRRTIPRAH